jgi:lipopolysaccharide export system protein LptC
MERAMLKSPVRKLLKFFQNSRNGWKAKCQQAKAQNKHWATQTRAVEKSREAWRQKAESAERELRALRQELEALKSTATA